MLHDAGPLLVLAGAGSGKTRVITFRIARLIRDGVPPESILAVTFTNKAALEMRQRVGKLVGAKSRKGLTVSTFHSLGHRLLRESAASIGLMPQFSIFDESEQIGTLRRIFRDVKIDDRKFDLKRVLANISRLKNAGIAPEDAPLEDADDYTLMTKEAYGRYQSALRSEHAVDFDDLLIRPTEMLRERTELRDFYRRRYRYLLVDEYQDTNPIQFELLTQLCPNDGNLCVVGDDDQSIYGFRGAEVAHILSFGQHFGGAKEVALTQNYRSTSSILNAANSIIAKNEKRKPKQLWTSLGEGEPVEVRALLDDEGEAKFVVDKIIEATTTLGKKPEDIAVLYRSNVQSRPIEEALRFEHIPYRVVGGTEYFERKEVKDAAAYLRVAANPDDEISLRRIINYPGRGVGEGALDALAALAVGRGTTIYHVLPEPPPELRAGARSELIKLHGALERARAGFAGSQGPEDLAATAKNLLETVGLKDAIYKDCGDNLAQAARKLDNLNELPASLERAAKSNEDGLPLSQVLSRFLADMSLDRPEEGQDKDDKRGVTLITVHGAKGLEWSWVFFVGLEEDLLPHKRTLEDLSGDLSEERRLCYVGITRARERLWITHAKGRKRYGKLVPRTPSRFLSDLGDGVQRVDDSQVSEPTAEEREQTAEDFFAKMRARLGY